MPGATMETEPTTASARGADGRCVDTLHRAQVRKRDVGAREICPGWLPTGVAHERRDCDEIPGYVLFDFL